MSVAVKRIYNPGWEKLPREEQAILRERLRALCTKDAEKGISEYLKLFEEIIPKIQSLIVEMLDKEKPTKDEKASAKDAAAKTADYAKRLLEVDAILIERLYIVQVASVEGWRFANDVDFYQSGASENTAYVKALEKRDKDRRRSDSSSRYGPYNTSRGGGRMSRQRGGRNDQGWSQPWGFQQIPMGQQFPMQAPQQNFNSQSYQTNQIPSYAPPPPPPPPSASSASRGRCLNCGSPSHFVKDCPTKPAYPLSLSGPQRQ